MIKKKCTKDTQASAENTLGNLIKTQETIFFLWIWRHLRSPGSLFTVFLQEDCSKKPTVGGLCGLDFTDGVMPWLKELTHKTSIAYEMNSQVLTEPVPLLMATPALVSCEPFTTPLFSCHWSKVHVWSWLKTHTLLLGIRYRILVYMLFLYYRPGFTIQTLDSEVLHSQICLFMVHWLDCANWSLGVSGLAWVVLWSSLLTVVQ